MVASIKESLNTMPLMATDILSGQITSNTKDFGRITECMVRGISSGPMDEGMKESI